MAPRDFSHLKFRSLDECVKPALDAMRDIKKIGDQRRAQREIAPTPIVRAEKAVWSYRERRLNTGHSNGGKVKIFSRAEVEALNRSLREKKSP